MAETEALLPEDAWPVVDDSNHDVGALPDALGGAATSGVSAVALMLLLTLRGTPVLYYGDEIGMPRPRSRADRVVDPVGLRDDRDEPGRDGARTADAVDATSRAPGSPPRASSRGCRSATSRRQRRRPARRPGSVLHLVRDLIALRRADDALHAGAYTPLDAPDGAWAYRRGDRAAVALNLSDAGVVVPGLTGRVEIGTDRARDGEALEGSVALGPWEGVVAIT